MGALPLYRLSSLWKLPRLASQSINRFRQSNPLFSYEGPFFTPDKTGGARWPITAPRTTAAGREGNHFASLRSAWVLRRDSTEQEALRQVGIPSLGSSHCVRTTYATTKITNQAHCGIFDHLQFANLFPQCHSNPCLNLNTSHRGLTEDAFDMSWTGKISRRYCCGRCASTSS